MGLSRLVIPYRQTISIDFTTDAKLMPFVTSSLDIIIAD